MARETCGVNIDFDFHDKSVLVTGAAQGIGYEIVKLFSQAGASVTAIDRSESTLARAWEGGGHHELELGAKQSDARCSGLGNMRQVDQQAGVEHQCHRLAVLGDAWLVAQGEVLLLASCAQAHALGVGSFEVGGGPDVDVA